MTDTNKPIDANLDADMTTLTGTIAPPTDVGTPDGNAQVMEVSSEFVDDTGDPDGE